MKQGRKQGHSMRLVCAAGTERCHEAASKLEEEGMAFDIVINIQGDEPLIDPGIIDKCVHALKSAPDAMYRFV